MFQKLLLEQPLAQNDVDLSLMLNEIHVELCFVSMEYRVRV